MKSKSVNAAMRVIQAVNREVDQSFYAEFATGQPMTGLPQVSEDETRERGQKAREMLALIQTIELESLPHELAISVLVARQLFEKNAALGEHYWHVHDLAGAFPGMFSMTSYSGGFVLNMIHQGLARQPLEHSGDCDRYLGLVEDYARLVKQMRERTVGQAERGLRINRLQLQQARVLLGAMGQAAGQALPVSPDRLEGIAGRDAFSEELDRRIRTSVLPAYQELVDYLDQDYEGAAPEAVGLCSLPGGDEVYAALIPMHLTLDMKAEEVQAAGHARMARIGERMAELRTLMGEGSESEFHAKLRSDRRFIAESAQEVEDRFNRYLRRIEPEMKNYFHELVEAPYAPKPLPDELSASMTFGYYDVPRKDKPEGHYLFNASNLEEKSQAWAGSLIYHELIPGHHFQLSKVRESDDLIGFRGKVMFTAYAEGWAEYAAGLAGEMGMYEDPLDEYGRCITDAFLTSRLVVDTGMNAFGWSLEKARAYMKEKTFFSEYEINSETLRYSSDIPGQALGYKLGDTKILELRDRVRQARGAAFDIKDFHDLILDVGSIPLTALEWHVEQSIRKEA